MSNWIVAVSYNLEDHPNNSLDSSLERVVGRLISLHDTDVDEGLRNVYWEDLEASVAEEIMHKIDNAYTDEVVTSVFQPDLNCDEYEEDYGPTYELYLPYYKKGDDLSHYLGANKDDVSKALQDHADALKHAAAMLERLRPYADKIRIFADTHMISVESDDQELLDTLVQEDILTRCEY